MAPAKVALLGGVGTTSKLSGALVDTLAATHQVVAVARSNKGKDALTARFAHRRGVHFMWGDLGDEAVVTDIVARAEQLGPIEVYIHNAAQFYARPFLQCPPADFQQAWQMAVMAAVVTCRAVLPAMVKRRRGTIIMSGATASLRGSAGCSSFAVAKFGQRALAQSLAREFGPRGIHVVSLIIDGAIVGRQAQSTFGLSVEKCIDAAALADTYRMLIDQPPTCWTHELDVRTHREPF